MYNIYGSPGFLAAYNAGPGRLDDYLTRNRVLPPETRRYVAAIGPRISGAEPRTPSPGAQYALNALPFSIPDGPRYSGSSRYSAPSDDAPVAAPVLAQAAPPIVLRPQPVQVAEFPAVRYSPLPAPVLAQAAAPPIVLRPQPVEVAEVPAARYSPLPAPAPAAFASVTPAPFVSTPPAPVRAPVQVAQALPTPPVPRLSQFAQMPEPPRPVAAPGRAADQRVLASAALVPLSPSRGGFSLVTPASAEPILRHGASGGGSGWAVQVGAYANEGLASSANASARDHARDVLGPARASITAVRQPHGTLYRARLTGLSRDAAAQACERLAHARTTCMVVSPDAQL